MRKDLNMKHKTTLVVTLALLGAWALAASGEAPGADDDHAHGRRRSAAGRECRAECTDKLAAVNQHLDAAVKAIEAGEKEAALTHLRAARTTFANMSKTCPACSAHTGGGEKLTSAGSDPVNTHCPIMGGKIDPAKVTPSVTREWRGKKVAFCCPPCTGKWEKLTEEQKQAALAKATQAPAATPAPAPEPKKGCSSKGGCCPK